MVLSKYSLSAPNLQAGYQELVPVSPLYSSAPSKLGLIPSSHFPTDLRCVVLFGEHAPEL